MQLTPEQVLHHRQLSLATLNMGDALEELRPGQRRQDSFDLTLTIAVA
jgi:hypothetical protein